MALELFRLRSLTGSTSFPVPDDCANPALVEGLDDEPDDDTDIDAASGSGRCAVEEEKAMLGAAFESGDVAFWDLRKV